VKEYMQQHVKYVNRYEIQQFKLKII